MTDHEDTADPAAVADTLRRLLDAVDRGEISATENEYSQLRGAVIALEAQDRLS